MKSILKSTKKDSNANDWDKVLGNFDNRMKFIKKIIN